MMLTDTFFMAAVAERSAGNKSKFLASAFLRVGSNAGSSRPKTESLRYLSLQIIDTSEPDGITFERLDSSYNEQSGKMLIARNAATLERAHVINDRSGPSKGTRIPCTQSVKIDDGLR
ncbi:MAG: hypothetical protein V9G24_11660 [Rhodoblastus sp.]